MTAKKVVIYTSESCPYCTRAKDLMRRRGIKYEEILIGWDDDAQWDALYERSGMKTVPQIFQGAKLIGGYSDLAKLDEQDQLASLK